MPNGNLKHEVACPSCQEKRLVRSDVILKLTRLEKPLICKPCQNRMRFANKDHPRKGMGVANNPNLKRTVSSYYKAKQRCKAGSTHHPCYENVEFKFDSFKQFVDCVGIRPEGMTLDRIDQLGHYEPNNVRWATVLQQAQNRMPRNYWANREKWT